MVITNINTRHRRVPMTKSVRFDISQETLMRSRAHASISSRRKCYKKEDQETEDELRRPKWIIKPHQMSCSLWPSRPEHPPLDLITFTRLCASSNKAIFYSPDTMISISSAGTYPSYTVLTTRLITLCTKIAIRMLDRKSTLISLDTYVHSIYQVVAFLRGKRFQVENTHSLKTRIYQAVAPSSYFETTRHAGSKRFKRLQPIH